jgi:hypothetical protein
MNNIKRELNKTQISSIIDKLYMHRVS